MLRKLIARLTTPPPPPQPTVTRQQPPRTLACSNDHTHNSQGLRKVGGAYLCQYCYWFTNY